MKNNYSYCFGLFRAMYWRNGAVVKPICCTMQKRRHLACCRVGVSPRLDTRCCRKRLSVEFCRRTVLDGNLMIAGGEARHWLCRSFLRTLSRCMPVGRIQPEPGASSFVSRSASYRLRGWALMAGFYTVTLVGARQTLESGGYHRCRVGACSIQTF